MPYSFKILIETITAEDTSKEQPKIREYTPEEVSSRTGRVKSSDKISIDFNWNVSLEAPKHMQMEHVIHYTDQQSLIAELRNQLITFNNYPKVANLRGNSNFRQTISFFKTDHTSSLPDFSIHAIAIVLAENHPVMQLKEQKRNSFCSSQQFRELEQKLKNYCALLKLKRTGNNKNKNLVFLITICSIALISLVLPFNFILNILMLSVLLTAASVFRTNFVVLLGFFYYNTPDKIKKITSPSEKAAFVAGYTNASFFSSFKHLRHPIVFAAGIKFCINKNENEMMQSELVNLLLVEENPSLLTPQKEQLREICLKATEARCKAITPLSVLSQQNAQLNSTEKATQDPVAINQMSDLALR